MENFIFGAVNPIYLIVNSKYYDSKYNGYDSSLAAINCGIPQGYVLGPLLFSLYIKDLNQAIKFLKVHHFADDNSLGIISGYFYQRTGQKSQCWIKYLVNWLNSNRMSLNVKNWNCNPRI